MVVGSGVQRRLRGLLVLVACYQSAAHTSARWPDHVLGAGPPRGHSSCMGIHAHPAVSSMVLGPFRKVALGGLLQPVLVIALG